MASLREKYVLVCRDRLMLTIERDQLQKNLSGCIDEANRERIRGENAERERAILLHTVGVLSRLADRLEVR